MSKSNTRIASTESFASISAVERDTGISKDTLRIWERRYGFPVPERDANGERTYPQDQVVRLRLLKRLADGGHRPRNIVPAELHELEQLARGSPAGGPQEPDAHEDFMSTLKSHDADRMQQLLTQGLMRQGLEQFVIETVAALNVRVGEAWARGELAVHEEHLYAQQIENTLRHAIFLASRRGSKPRVLLTSVPGEQHRIGLLMAEAVFTAAGAFCIPLGAQTPVSDIALGAAAHRVDIVALSFSSVFQPGPARQSLSDLRAMLPAAVAIWAGGQGLQRVRDVPGVELLRDFAQLQQALAGWQGSKSTTANS